MLSDFLFDSVALVVPNWLNATDKREIWHFGTNKSIEEKKKRKPESLNTATDISARCEREKKTLVMFSFFCFLFFVFFFVYLLFFC